MRRAWVGGLALLAAAPAQAHVTSTGLATFDVRHQAPAYRLTLNPAELGSGADDLVRAAAGDADAAARTAAWVPTRLALAVDGKACRVARLRVQGSPSGDDRVALWLDFACPAATGTMQLTDQLWQQFGEHYRTIVSVTRADGSREERVLDQEHPSVSIGASPAADGQAPQGWWDFGRLGFEHILSGLDHLLFLAALLVGSRSLRRLLITVTAFTLAHSAALALAVLGWVNLSAAIVEPLIAASIVWVALENLWSAQAAVLRRYALAFGFGLVHGLAFSEILRELQLAGWPLLRALAGFNLGVEAGQALVVAVLAPLLAWAAGRTAAARVWERVASAIIALIGLAWLVQRLAAG